MWSVGCIMAELFLKRPLFTGDDFLNQLSLIFSVIGKPSAEELESLQNQQAKRFLGSLPETTRVPFSTLLPDINPLFIDFMEKIFHYHPEKRMSASEALKHPIFKDCGVSYSEKLGKSRINKRSGSERLFEIHI